jgi:hypothetical protein
MPQARVTKLTGNSVCPELHRNLWIYRIRAPKRRKGLIPLEFESFDRNAQTIAYSPFKRLQSVANFHPSTHILAVSQVFALVVACSYLWCTPCDRTDTDSF